MISEIEIKEIQKCFNDPAYFAESCIKVKHPSSKMVDFKPYNFQKQLLKNYAKDNLNIVVHARRLGISTLNCSFALWEAIFHSFRTIYLVSDRLDTLNFSIDRLRFMWSNLPAFITNGLKLVYNNKQYMEFDNGSRILFGRADISITRGLSVNTMICDNFAFISLQRAEEFWITLHPSIPISGKIILTSAYNPESNLFNKIWRQSEKGLNTFKRHQLLFYDVTDKDANDFIEDPV